MPGISKVIFTDVFWEAVDGQRREGRYDFFRDKIETCIRNKATDMGYESPSDSAFKSAALKGLWHLKLSRDTDTTLIYAMEKDTMVLGLIGGHELYGYKGKDNGEGAKTAAKIRAALVRGNVPVPGWSNVKWKTPFDLVANRDLAEASIKQLDTIREMLTAENDHPKMMERHFGMSLDEIPFEEFSKWMDGVDTAMKRVGEILIERPLFEKKYKMAMPAAYFAEAPRPSMY